MVHLINRSIFTYQLPHAKFFRFSDCFNKSNCYFDKIDLYRINQRRNKWVNDDLRPYEIRFHFMKLLFFLIAAIISSCKGLVSSSIFLVLIVSTSTKYIVLIYRRAHIVCQSNRFFIMKIHSSSFFAVWITAVLWRIKHVYACINISTMFDVCIYLLVCSGLWVWYILFSVCALCFVEKKYVFCKWSSLCNTCWLKVWGTLLFLKKCYLCMQAIILFWVLFRLIKNVR